MKVAAPALGVAFAAAALLLGADAVFAVDQSQQALVLSLGRPVRLANADGRSAGLYLKWPLLDRVVRLDRRSFTQSWPAQDIATADQTRLGVAASLRYRIVDPLRYYSALGATSDGAQRLQVLVDRSVRDAFSGAPMQDIVAAGGGARLRTALTEAQRMAARDQLGIGVEDIGLLNVAPSDTEVDAVSRRMQTAELAQAGLVRAEGETQRRNLLAAADREVADIRGEAERRALEVRGDGDAQRADILGAAYSQDPSFARFFRRLEAYDQALNPDNTTLVLSPDTAFLDLFGHGPSGVPNPR